MTFSLANQTVVGLGGVCDWNKFHADMTLRGMTILIRFFRNSLSNSRMTLCPGLIVRPRCLTVSVNLIIKLA